MKTSPAQRRKIVDKAHLKLSVTRQCELLAIHRSGYYYNLQEKKEDAFNLELMKLIDQHYLKHPYMGVPSMIQWLVKDMGFHVNRKRIARLYKMMDLSAIVPGPHTSMGCKEHKKYLYLLRNLVIDHPNQVWGIDITYIPIKIWWPLLTFLAALWSDGPLSNTMESEWIVETVKEAINRHGKPEMMNSDQGSQFTGDLYTGFLTGENITISMGGRGRATDNIFVERLWQSLKYEDIYLNAYETGPELYKGLKRIKLKRLYPSILN